MFLGHHYKLSFFFFKHSLLNLDHIYVQANKDLLNSRIAIYYICQMHKQLRLWPGEKLSSPVDITGDLLLLGLKAQVTNSHSVFFYLSRNIKILWENFISQCSLFFILLFLNYQNWIRPYFMKLSSKCKLIVISYKRT